MISTIFTPHISFIKIRFWTRILSSPALMASKKLSPLHSVIFSYFHFFLCIQDSAFSLNLFILFIQILKKDLHFIYLCLGYLFFSSLSFSSDFISFLLFFSSFIFYSFTDPLSFVTASSTCPRIPLTYHPYN